METAVRLVNAYMVEGVLLLIVIVAIKVLAISFKHTKPILPSLVRETFEDHEETVCNAEQFKFISFIPLI